MSRIFTIVVILLLVAVVALVPHIGTDDTGLDLGECYAYREDTLARFRRLLEEDGWSLADPPRNPQGMLTAKHHRTGLVFVLIPEGEFMMGTSEEGWGLLSTRSTLHRVAVPAFLMCGTECTQRAWEVGGGENGSMFGGDDHPVECVDWTRCREWCAQNDLRLPSEAEWEKSCRAGTKTRFPFGDDEAHLSNYAWFGEDDNGSTHPAARKSPNQWGLHDMHGNVWEWCEDKWHSDFVEAPTDGSSRLTGNPFAGRVGRGGGWHHPPHQCRSAYRGNGPPELRSEHLGFRPAADLPEVK